MPLGRTALLLGISSFLNPSSKMKTTVNNRILQRELGSAQRDASVRGIYGDKTWVDKLDIVNELGGHSGCVNALKHVFYFRMLIDPQY